MRWLALWSALVVMLCSSVASAQGKSVMVVELARVRGELDAMPDRACPTIVQANQDAYGALREYYHSLPREKTPFYDAAYDGIEGVKLPPRMSREDREALDAFIEDAALHAARCVSDLPDGGEQALSFWIHHANTLIFRIIDPDIEQRGIVERVIGRSLDSNQEALITLMIEQVEATGDSRGAEMLVRAIARERATELEIKLSRLASRTSRERERQRSYVGFLVGLTLFLLVLVWFGTQLRPGFARVSIPRAPHAIWRPYKVRPEQDDEGSTLVSMHVWRQRLVRFSLRFGIAGILLVMIGLWVIHHAFGVLGSDRGFIEVIGGWALVALGVAILTHRFWYRPSEELEVESISRVRELDSHDGVLDVLEALQASYYAILLEHPAWLSFSPGRDPLQQGDGERKPMSVGQGCAMLWKGMMRMRGRRPELPPIRYTTSISRAYVASKDEWGDAFEAYWDELVALDAPREHLDQMQRVWDIKHYTWHREFRGVPLEIEALSAFLTRAMLTGRRWRRARWWSLFFSTEAMRAQTTPLIWVAEQGASQALFWVDESLECVTPDGEVVHIEEHAYIRIAHAADFSQAQYVEWGEHLADHEFVQCVHQLDRYPETWDVPDTAKWIILEGGQMRFDMLPHVSVSSVTVLGVLPCFGVTVCGYSGPRGEVGVAAMIHDGKQGMLRLSSLPPVLFAELCFIARHHIGARAQLEAFYEGTSLLAQ